MVGEISTNFSFSLEYGITCYYQMICCCKKKENQIIMTTKLRLIFCISQTVFQ